MSRDDCIYVISFVYKGKLRYFILNDASTRSYENWDIVVKHARRILMFEERNCRGLEEAKDIGWCMKDDVGTQYGVFAYQHNDRELTEDMIKPPRK